MTIAKQSNIIMVGLVLTLVFVFFIAYQTNIKGKKS